MKFGKSILVLMVILFLIPSLMLGDKFGTKFRDIPEDVLRLLTKMVTAAPLTPEGPNGVMAKSLNDLVITPDEEKKIKNLNLGDYYFVAGTVDITEQLNIYGMNQELAKYGFPEIKFMGASSIGEQIDQVHSLAAKAKNIAFIAAEPWESVSTAPAFQELARAGVPQVHLWAPAKDMYKEKNFVGLIDADGYAEGVATAEMLAYAMGYKGEVGILNFALDFWTTKVRLKGALDTFAKYPDIKVVVQQDFTDPSQCFDLTVGMLRAHPEIDAIWASWLMGPATGAAEAVMALNKVGEVIIATPDLGGKTGAKYLVDPNYPLIGVAEPVCIDMGKVATRAILKFLIGDTSLAGGYYVAKVYPVTHLNLLEVYKETNEPVLGPLPDEVLNLLNESKNK